MNEGATSALVPFPLSTVCGLCTSSLRCFRAAKSDKKRVGQMEDVGEKLEQ